MNATDTNIAVTPTFAIPTAHEAVARVNRWLHREKPFSLVFLLGISCLWYGSNNASKEIVKERPIYLRERDVNLSVLSYLLSKMVVQGMIGALQVLILFGLVQWLSVIPGEDSRQLIQMVMAVLTGTSIGLLISAATSSRDQASTFVPIVLIPQIVLGGLIVKDLPYIPDIIAHGVVSGFWVYQEMEAVLRGDDAQAQFALLVQAAHCITFCSLAYVVLLVRDARRGEVYGESVVAWMKIARQRLNIRTRHL